MLRNDGAWGVETDTSPRFSRLAYSSVIAILPLVIARPLQSSHSQTITTSTNGLERSSIHSRFTSFPSFRPVALSSGHPEVRPSAGDTMPAPKGSASLALPLLLVLRVLPCSCCSCSRGGADGDYHSEGKALAVTRWFAWRCFRFLLLLALCALLCSRSRGGIIRDRKMATNRYVTCITGI